MEGFIAKWYANLTKKALDDFRYMRAKGLIDAANEDQARQIEALLAGR